MCVNEDAHRPPAMGGGDKGQRTILGNRFSSSKVGTKTINPKGRHQSRAERTGEEIHVHRLEGPVLLRYQLVFQLIYRVSMTTTEIQANCLIDIGRVNINIFMERQRT